MKNSEFEKEGLQPSRNLTLTPMHEASGGTCRLFTARLSGKKVFVKEIRPEFADDARMLAAFRKEAEIGFRLDHRNLPRYIYAEGILPPDRYIVQEFIDGLTLSNFIKEDPSYFRNKQNLKRIVRELADVIDYLHRNGIVHLDLKPENIIITRVGHTLKLVDLGFCASDFYDDTRGFTRSELAPEGIAEPRDRGVESDYYGIGKILSYLLSHTPGLRGSEFRKLENRLLQPEPAKRLSSKEEIEKLLGRNVGAGKVWLVTASALIVSAIVLFLILAVVKNSHDAQADETVGIHNSRALKDTETNKMEYLDNSTEPDGVGVPKETHRDTYTTHRPREADLLWKNQKSDTPAQSMFSFDSYERLKAEIAENINKNFADFNKMLSSFIQEGRYSEKDYEIITASYREALHKTFGTDRYKAKYKDLSPSLIDETTAELLQEIEKKTWGPALKKYTGQYQALESDFSR